MKTTFWFGNDLKSDNFDAEGILICSILFALVFGNVFLFMNIYLPNISSVCGSLQQPDCTLDNWDVFVSHHLWIIILVSIIIAEAYILIASKVCNKKIKTIGGTIALKIATLFPSFYISCGVVGLAYNIKITVNDCLNILIGLGVLTTMAGVLFGWAALNRYLINRGK